MERSLSDAQIEYYSRQILLRELGGLGQKRLLGAACLVVGSGEATAVAATYLAGAGIGRLDLLGAGPPRSGDVSPLAPLEDRNPDVRLRRLDGPPARLDAYDAAILEARAAPLLTPVRGRPRHGEIRIEIHGDGATALLLVPAAAQSCALCAHCEPGPPSSPGAVTAEGGALELAGALAALAACRWVAGLSADAEATGWRLAPGAPTWEAIAVATSPSCARGCRS